LIAFIDFYSKSQECNSESNLLVVSMINTMIF